MYDGNEEHYENQFVWFQLLIDVCSMYVRYLNLDLFYVAELEKHFSAMVLMLMVAKKESILLDENRMTRFSFLFFLHYIHADEKYIYSNLRLPV